MRHADGYGPGPAAGPDDLARSAGPASAGGMCPWCRNMAMMQPHPGQPGGMQDMPAMRNMPDMQQDAPASPLALSRAPETPMN